MYSISLSEYYKLDNFEVVAVSLFDHTACIQIFKGALCPYLRSRDEVHGEVVYVLEVDDEVVLAHEGLLAELARQHLRVLLGVEVVLLLHLGLLLLQLTVVGAEVVLDVLLAVRLGHVNLRET